ncbi:MAG: hypothetical protein IPK60_06335 [Sandaracinaceae bacterium]|nr:hypothetical protein [Sandaracinaceae bacterium]
MIRTSLLAFALVFLAGCEDPPPPSFRVTFTAVEDDVKLAGVEVNVAGHSIGRTNANGELQANLLGREGASVPYRVRCPVGHREFPNPFSLTLRSFRGIANHNNARGVEVSINCLPTERYAAVVIRTGGRADLPVMLQGQEVTRTDSGGVAHLLLRFSPNSNFRVSLDTSSIPRLSPANPAEIFTLTDADDIFIFDQQFTETRPPRRRRPPPGPVFTGPIRIH